MATEPSNNANSELSLQEQLFTAIQNKYPDAEAKKINKDNFLDIYIPSISPGRGTHLFFNTVKDVIKVGFYCRDEDFVEEVLSNSSNIEKYAQGIRILNNPIQNDVEEATMSALSFIEEITGEQNEIKVEEIDIDATLNEEGEENESEVEEFEDDDFEEEEDDFLKTLAIEIPFKEYHSENDADLNIVINIYGRMHQIFECINKEEEDIDAIEDHYQNIFDWKYKIDDDNLMIIELDGEKIFDGSILELAIRDDVEVYNLEPFQQNYIKSKLKRYNEEFDEFHEFDSDDAWVSKKNYLLRIPQGRLEGDRGLELAPNFNNRYSMINYGKYHLKAFVKVKSFSISDLFFQMEPDMDYLISEPDGGPYYNFSKIFHYEEGELELEVVSENLKGTEFQNGWLYDF